jgi:hypothetical protein
VIDGHLTPKGLCVKSHLYPTTLSQLALLGVDSTWDQILKEDIRAVPEMDLKDLTVGYNAERHTAPHEAWYLQLMRLCVQGQGKLIRLIAHETRNGYPPEAVRDLLLYLHDILGPSSVSALTHRLSMMGHTFDPAAYAEYKASKYCQRVTHYLYMAHDLGIAEASEPVRRRLSRDDLWLLQLLLPRLHQGEKLRTIPDNVQEAGFDSHKTFRL